MNLGLHTYPAPKEKPATLESGAIQLPSTQTRKIIAVVNAETGEEVENVAAFIWGPGEGFTGAIEAPGLFEPEHFKKGKEYVLIAFECEAMVEYEEGPVKE